MIKVAFLFVFLVLVGNIVFLDYVFVKQQEEAKDVKTRIGTLADSFKILTGRVEEVEEVSPSAQIQTPTEDNGCPQSCATAFNAAISKVKIPPPAPVAKPIVQKGEYIVPLGSGQVGSVGTWVDAYTAQATIDTANYPSIRAFYFEAVMHVAQGEVQAKLVDDTTPFAYDGQVLKTTSGTGQLLSVQVPLQSGKKTYHVQLYTSISPGVLDSARIRVVTQ